jgi:hypothetical protein
VTLTRTRKRVALGVALVLFLALSACAARWLSAEGVERAKIERVIEAQARGDGVAIDREVDGKCECDDLIYRLARTLRGPGRVEIVRYDSATSHALRTTSGPTRVVWRRGNEIPTVQCFEVLRRGHALRGTRVTLLRLSAPIGLEAAC